MAHFSKQRIVDRNAEARDEFVEFSDFAAAEIQQVPERAADISVVFVRTIRPKRDPVLWRGKQRRQTFAGGHVPELDRTVTASAGNLESVRAERNAPDCRSMPREGPQFRAAGDGVSRRLAV